jgi:hypothetical protein
MIPIVSAIEQEIGPQHWIASIGECLMQCASAFEASLRSRNTTGDSDWYWLLHDTCDYCVDTASCSSETGANRVLHIHPVTTHHPGHGNARPSKRVDVLLLREAMSERRKLTLTMLADALKIH